LIAEDEGLIMTVARMALEREGYLVLTAEDGEEALDVSRKFPGSIHALVADVSMPKMDGIELRKRIVAERPGIKVLLTSAFVHAPVQRVPFSIQAVRRERAEGVNPPASHHGGAGVTANSRKC